MGPSTGAMSVVCVCVYVCLRACACVRARAHAQTARHPRASAARWVDRAGTADPPDRDGSLAAAGVFCFGHGARGGDGRRPIPPRRPRRPLSPAGISVFGECAVAPAGSVASSVASAPVVVAVRVGAVVLLADHAHSAGARCLCESVLAGWQVLVDADRGARRRPAAGGKRALPPVAGCGALYHPRLPVDRQPAAGVAAVGGGRSGHAPAGGRPEHRIRCVRPGAADRPPEGRALVGGARAVRVFRVVALVVHFRDLDSHRGAVPGHARRLCGQPACGVRRRAAGRARPTAAGTVGVVDWRGQRAHQVVRAGEPYSRVPRPVPPDAEDAALLHYVARSPIDWLRTSLPERRGDADAVRLLRAWLSFPVATPLPGHRLTRALEDNVVRLRRALHNSTWPVTAALSRTAAGAIDPQTDSRPLPPSIWGHERDVRGGRRRATAAGVVLAHGACGAAGSPAGEGIARVPIGKSHRALRERRIGWAVPRAGRAGISAAQLWRSPASTCSAEIALDRAALGCVAGNSGRSGVSAHAFSTLFAPDNAIAEAILCAFPHRIAGVGVAALVHCVLYVPIWTAVQAVGRGHCRGRRARCGPARVPQRIPLFGGPTDAAAARFSAAVDDSVLASDSAGAARPVVAATGAQVLLVEQHSPAGYRHHRSGAAGEPVCRRRQTAVDGSDGAQRGASAHRKPAVSSVSGRGTLPGV
eukprot:ctg_1038.g376